MFSGLGGNETWQKPKKTYADDDEFHLGTGSDADSIAAQIAADDSLTRILDQYPIDMAQLEHLEGESKVQATHELYRRGALRDARVSTWIREQCAPLLIEHQECLSKATIKIPLITCAREEDAYSHCLSVAKVRSRPTKFPVLSSLLPLICPLTLECLLLCLIYLSSYRGRQTIGRRTTRPAKTSSGLSS